MTFGSFPFLFLFLPVTLAGFFLLGRQRPSWAAGWLLLASLVFYGSWNVSYLPILFVSIIGNYLAYGRIVQATPAAKPRWLTAAIAFNLLLLAYFKYADFFIGSVNDLTGGDIPLLHTLLPIGISFFTFTQIAFLVDAYHGKVEAPGLGRYVLFASYFPYIVAGPVLHHKEMIPQFADRQNYIPRAENFAVGITLFAFGLAKKVLLADNLSPVANSLLAGDDPQLWQAWLGMFAYTFQLYFDFSGYSDMALGVSRMLGFQIPFNFDSPYKAANVSEFWLRWHISLSRFLRNYLYIPLGGNRHGQFKRYRNLLLTMLLGGLWHGANWTFVIWGGLHGLYLCVQHGWQQLRGKPGEAASPLATFLSRVLTFLAVMVAWCFFRAPDVASAMGVLAGMAGQNGVSAALDLGLFEYGVIAVSAGIAWGLPNTNELVLHLGNRFAQPLGAYSVLGLKWQPSPRWGLVTAALLAVCILGMERTADFIYAQF